MGLETPHRRAPSLPKMSQYDLVLGLVLSMIIGIMSMVAIEIYRAGVIDGFILISSMMQLGFAFLYILIANKGN